MRKTALKIGAPPKDNGHGIERSNKKGKPSTASDIACNVEETSLCDEDQFGKVQVQLINETAPIMMSFFPHIPAPPDGVAFPPSTRSVFFQSPLAVRAAFCPALCGPTLMVPCAPVMSVPPLSVYRD